MADLVAGDFRIRFNDSVVQYSVNNGVTWATLGSIADGSITMAKLADIATETVIGRVAAGTGVPKALSKTELTTLINAATQSLAGAMSAADKTKLDGMGLTISVLGSDVTNHDIAVSGQGVHVVHYHIVGANGAIYYCHPNSLTTDLNSVRLVNNGAAATPSAATTLILGDVTADLFLSGQFSLSNFTGAYHFFKGDSVRKSGAGIGSYDVRGYWLQTTDLTTIRLNCDTASGIKTGTVIASARLGPA